MSKQPTNFPSHRRARLSHCGFTLVELLIAIAILAILTGLLAAGIMPVLTTVRETAITTEMKQIDQAIENFRNQYGFYPPSFEAGIDANGNVVGITSADDLARYINRISPNHAEGETHPVHTTETRLGHWYDEVGQYLDQESSLVFWLSGLCKNKQYPLSGGSNAATAPLVAHNYGNDNIERDVFFDFKTGQLVEEDAAGTVLDISGNAVTTIFKYKQAYGPQDSNLFYKYRDAATYDLSDAGGAQPEQTAYRVGRYTRFWKQLMTHITTTLSTRIHSS